MRLAAQHVLSLSRLPLGAVVLAALTSGSRSPIVLPAVALACAADFADGIVARRRGAETSAGRLVDNLCDAAFLTLALCGFAAAQTWSLPPLGSATRIWQHANWLPLIGLASSFGTYLARWLFAFSRGVAPRRSARGHFAGIANYVLVIAGAVAVVPGVELTRWLLEPLFVTVALLNFGAAVENIGLLMRRSDSPAS